MPCNVINKITTDLTRLFEGKDSKSPVTVVAYSPAGDTLAVGVEDGSIFLYAVPDEYELIGKCVRHTSSIISMDFSLVSGCDRASPTPPLIPLIILLIHAVIYPLILSLADLSLNRMVNGCEPILQPWMCSFGPPMMPRYVLRYTL